MVVISYEIWNFDHLFIVCKLIQISQSIIDRKLKHPLQFIVDKVKWTSFSKVIVTVLLSETSIFSWTCFHNAILSKSYMHGQFV